MSGRRATKTDRQMEDAMLAAAGDRQRVNVLALARTFKRSWIDLAEALTDVHEQESWRRWGFADFDTYCASELHLRKRTVVKLLGSFRFLKARAPRVIERAHSQATAAVPTLQAVEFVARAADRAAADAKTMRAIETAAFEEGAEAPLLSRRFRDVAFPLDRGQRVEQLRAQLTQSARRLAHLVAEPDAPIPHEVAIAVEEALGRLLDSLEASG